MDIHPLLSRHIEQHVPDASALDQLEKFVEAVNSAYRTFDSLAAEQIEQHVTQLQRSEETYRSMFENATDGVFQTTADGQYLNCNRALAQIYGYEGPEELKGSVRDIKRQLYVDDGTRPLFIQLMQKHDHVSGFEARIYRKDGSIIWISETARAVRDARKVSIFRGVCFGHHGASERRRHYAKVRKDMRWPFAEQMMEFGTGT